MINDTSKTGDMATFTDETVTLAAFRSYVSANAGGKSVDPSLVLVAPYKEVLTPLLRDLKGVAYKTTKWRFVSYLAN
jgi:hypothetical protein